MGCHGRRRTPQITTCMGGMVQSVFSSIKSSPIRKDVSSIRQESDITDHESWIRLLFTLCHLQFQAYLPPFCGFVDVTYSSCTANDARAQAALDPHGGCVWVTVASESNRCECPRSCVRPRFLVVRIKSSESISRIDTS